jgi:hypothetical protein
MHTVMSKKLKMKFIDELFEDMPISQNLYHLVPPIIPICGYCRVEMKFCISDNIYLCGVCGYNERQSLFIPQNEKTLINNKQNDIKTYKRINHFSDFLRQMQIKDNMDIPESLLENIKQEMKKSYPKSTKLNYMQLKNILKKLNLKEHYENIPRILLKINNFKNKIKIDLF